VEREHRWKQASIPLSAFSGLIYGSSWRAYSALHPRFFTYGAVSELSWRQPETGSKQKNKICKRKQEIEKQPNEKPAVTTISRKTVSWAQELSEASAFMVQNLETETSKENEQI
jgi:hypothetical protein